MRQEPQGATKYRHVLGIADYARGSENPGRPVWGAVRHRETVYCGSKWGRPVPWSVPSKQKEPERGSDIPRTEYKGTQPWHRSTLP
jgi:hypothetical protein